MIRSLIFFLLINRILRNRVEKKARLQSTKVSFHDRSRHENIVPPAERLPYPA